MLGMNVDRAREKRANEGGTSSAVKADLVSPNPSRSCLLTADLRTMAQAQTASDLAGGRPRRRLGGPCAPSALATPEPNIPVIAFDEIWCAMTGVTSLHRP